MELTRAPMTLKGKQIRTPPKSAPSKAYRTKAYSSDVDETLFGAPARYTQQKETKRMSDGKQWDPPWVTRPTNKGVPLLWTPFEYKDFHGALATDADSKAVSKLSTPRSARMRNKYRLKSHTPTFVDETLFGSKRDEPSFDAPWNNDDNNNLHSRHVLFTPESKQSCPLTPRSLVTALDRPGSRLGEYEDPYIPPTPRDAATANNYTSPVIRQRPGSSIQTPSKLKSRGSTKQKLNFSEPEDPETKEIIDRALRLAQATRDAAMSDRRFSNHSDSPWKRPVSASEHRSSPRVPRLSSARYSERSLEDDILSATGRKIPLSARSDQSSRPNSARVRSSSAQRSVTSRSDRPSWKP